MPIVRAGCGTDRAARPMKLPYPLEDDQAAIEAVGEEIN